MREDQDTKKIEEDDVKIDPADIEEVLQDGETNEEKLIKDIEKAGEL